ncbi:respiratory nitrate reductase subunit gamma [Oceanobacillus halophilus]|uniref:Respiratory nitrate reductase subunit gamma n=1 Tax=Oceanobacillus halophilus TaxID=930130 RepID=A0A494ZWB9_9BACI|nr:respiratory nitrate reductase subunit gamma [Oceanobacillus halophilus]RKQ30746.1 respiratory nitrate reductase subunit gamma [Oceanobacillus halophilus]
MADIFWWVIFPYITLTIMILGLLYRYAFRQLTWAAPSTNFFEKKWLRIGSPLFHYGIVFAFIGHVMGMVIPMEFYQALGISDHLYHMGAIWGGGLAGLMVVAGLIILLIRKMTIDPVRIKAGFADFFSVLALLFVAGTGTYMTIIFNTMVIEYEYRETIGPWFRSLFVFMPKYELMSGVPFIFKLHVVSAFALFASIPFTRLVHIFSFPIKYPARPPQQYRSRSNYRKQGL